MSGPPDGREGPSPTLHSLFDGLGVSALPDLAIHPGDAMLGFAESLTCGVREQARVEYFRSGHDAWTVVERSLRRFFGNRYPKRAPGRLLDFGAGHGRVLRYLLGDVGAKRVTVTEADPTATEFLAERFGVRAETTPSDPSEALMPFLNDEYDAIVALSVLTHLPERTFAAWLGRWLGALADGGLLIFSTLGPGTLLPGRTMPAAGFHHEAMSESKVLSLDDYGTTWVSESRVGLLLDELSGGLARWRYVPRGLWHLQDLWLVTCDPSGDLDPDVDAPTGSVEVCEVTGDGLRISGWALGGLTPPRAARFEIFVGGEKVAAVDAEHPRPDALAHLGLGCDAAHLPASFAVTVPSGRLDPAAQVRVDAVDAADRERGRRAVLHAASVEAGELFLRLRAAQRAADTLRDEVDVFEASGFGRLRRRWMEWKTRLGR